MKLHLPLFTRVLVLSKFAITTALVHGLLSNARGNELLNNVGVVRNSPQLIAESSNIPSTLSDGMRIENLSLMNGENTSFGIEGGAEVYIIGNTYGERASFSLGASSKLYFLADETGVSHMNVGTFSNGGGGNDFNREIIVGSGVNMSALSFSNGWGMKSLTVDGLLEIEETLRLNSGGERVGNIIDTNVITGNGSITVGSFRVDNFSDYNQISVASFTVTGNAVVARNLTISDGTVTRFLGNTEQRNVLSVVGGQLLLGDEINDISTFNGSVYLDDGNIYVKGSARAIGSYEQRGGVLEVQGSFTFSPSMQLDENAYVFIFKQGLITQQDGNVTITRSDGEVWGALSGTSIARESMYGADANHRGVVEGVHIDLAEGIEFSMAHLVLKSTTHITDAPATLALEDVTAELALDLNTAVLSVDEVLQAGSTLVQNGNETMSLTLAQDAVVVQLEATTFDSVTLTGASLVLQLSGVETEFFNGADYIAVTFTSGTGLATFGTDVEVLLTLDEEHFIHGYYVQGGDHTTMLFATNDKAVVTPEPATSTLSLLALAALAARRRRK